MLGDRVVIKSLAIKSGVIMVAMNHPRPPGLHGKSHLEEDPEV
jgi:hypothetical protein